MHVIFSFYLVYDLHTVIIKDYKNYKQAHLHIFMYGPKDDGRDMTFSFFNMQKHRGTMSWNHWRFGVEPNCQRNDFLEDTPRKINMESKNCWFVDVFSLCKWAFSGSILILRGFSHAKKTL